MSYFPDPLPKSLEVNDTPTGAYTLVDSDNGKLVEIDAGLTVPTGLAVGFRCRVHLDNASAQAITTTGVTVEGPEVAGQITANGTIDVVITATDTALIYGDLEEFTGITKAGTFDGVNEYLVSPNTTDGSIGQGDDTYNVAAFCWCRWDGTLPMPSSHSPFNKYVAASTNREWLIAGDRSGFNNKLYVVVSRDGSSSNIKLYIANDATDFADGTWHHVGFVFEGANGGGDGTLTLYQDGAAVTTVVKSVDATVTDIHTGGAASLAIGADSNTGSDWNGPVTGCCIFEGVGMSFGPAEVAELYGGGTATALNPSAHSLSANLLCSYTFDKPGDDMTATTGQIGSSVGSYADLTPTNTESGDLVDFP